MSLEVNVEVERAFVYTSFDVLSIHRELNSTTIWLLIDTHAFTYDWCELMMNKKTTLIFNECLSAQILYHKYIQLAHRSLSSLYQNLIINRNNLIIIIFQHLNEMHEIWGAAGQSPPPCHTIRCSSTKFTNRKLNRNIICNIYEIIIRS